MHENFSDYYSLLNGLVSTASRTPPTPDRTGTSTWSNYGCRMQFSLTGKDGLYNLPVMHEKSIHMKSVIHELLWFLSGDTNTAYLVNNKVRIWNEWADKDGNLGPVYGAQWRSFGGVDQIVGAEKLLIENPTTRRNVVSAWNVPAIPQMALPPCHAFFQLMVGRDESAGLDTALMMNVYMRSGDIFLGVPFNVTSYAILQALFARVAGLDVGQLTILFGDLHLYANHIDQAKELLLRRNTYKCKSSATVEIPKMSSVLDYKFDDIRVLDYKPMGPIPAPVAV